jgi:hypothetical protein
LCGRVGRQAMQRGRRRRLRWRQWSCRMFNHRRARYGKRAARRCALCRGDLSRCRADARPTMPQNLMPVTWGYSAGVASTVMRMQREESRASRPPPPVPVANKNAQQPPCCAGAVNRSWVLPRAAVQIALRRSR